ncbi:MAG: sigma-70 family RNA polymerase sigma factor [Planctomycetota bacterium]
MADVPPVGDSRTDRDLLRAMRRGEDAAARALWGRHAGPLVRYAESMVGAAEAEDVVQSAFVAALQRPPREIRRVRDPAAWLCRLTRNAALNARRAAERRSRWHDRGGRPVGETPPTRGDLPEALAQLDPELRDAVVLRHAYGFTVERLADALGVSRSTAADRYARGLREARNALDDRSKPDAAAPIVVHPEGVHHG